ncbi:MAG: META domain-containing protein [Hyphomicrobiales bacterium]|nr:MAG: META domain-containing protein [Hyphomicrobiales bacterium]
MRSAVLGALLSAAFCGSAVLVTLNALAAPALTGKWRILTVAGVDGLDAGKSRAEFAGNGRFASTVGCNRIAGAPSTSGGRLSFGPMMTTRMACPPPLDRVEQNYLAALQAARGYRLDGERLLFLDENGETLVALERERERP